MASSPNKTPDQTRQINEKHSFDSGTLRRTSHASSTTRKRQASRDSRNQQFINSTVNSTVEWLIETPTDSLNPEITKTGKIYTAPDNLRYINVDPSNNLDQYLLRHSKSLLRRVSAHPLKYQLKFSLRPEARDWQGHIQTYQAMGSLKITRRKELNVKATHSDVRAALALVIGRLEKKIHRYTEKNEASRKTLGRSKKPIGEYLWDLSFNS